MKKCLLMLISANFLLLGCADDQARVELASNSLKISKLQTDINSLNNKISGQNSLNIINKLDGIQNQINQLNGDVSNLKNSQESYKTKQEQMLQSLQQQLDSISLTKNSNTNDIPSIKKAEEVIDANKKEPSENAKLTSVNNNKLQLSQALKALKSRNFSQAIKELNILIKSTNDSSILSDSKYYLAISYAASNQYKNSINIARQALDDNPTSTHAPDILRTIFIAQTQLGQKSLAIATANELFKKYPNTPASKKVKDSMNK